MVNGINEEKVYTYQEIKDYMNCPLCYHIEHVEKRTPSLEYYKENRRVASDEAIIKTINNYYFLHMEGKPPSLKDVYKKYNTEFNKKLGVEQNKDQLIGEVTNDKIRSITRNAYSWLRRFYEWNAKTPQAIIAVNHDFIISYEELSIKGSFPLIREIENDKGEREIELIIFGQLSVASPEESIIEETDATFLLKGFKEAFGTNPDSLKVYSIERSKEYEVVRTEGDLKRLEISLLGFYYNVKNNQPYQRIGAHRRSGKFKKECDIYYD